MSQHSDQDTTPSQEGTTAAAPAPAVLSAGTPDSTPDSTPNSPPNSTPYSPSVAQPVVATQSAPDSPAAPLTEVLGTVLALAFVLGLAWIFLRILQRTGIAQNRSGKATLQVVQQVSLGGRERVALVRHGDREYLLGVTPHQVQLLSECTEQAREP